MLSGLVNAAPQAATDGKGGTCPARKTLRTLGLGVIFAFTLKGLVTTGLLVITLLEFAR